MLIKSTFAFAIVSIAILTAPTTLVFAQSPTIRINGQFIDIPANEGRPIIANGRAFVSLNTIEAIGFDVARQPASANQAILSRQGVEIVVTVGSNTMLVSGEPVTLDAPAQIISGYMMIPIRAVCEEARMFVRRNDANAFVEIFTGDVPRAWSSLETWPVNSSNWPEHLPKHVPGSIILHPEDVFEGLIDLSLPLQFRNIFYSIDGDFLDLASRDERRAFFDTVEGREPHEIMTLSRFVQHFNISREDFDAVVERRRANAEEWGVNLYDEWYERPNADIIFTFDNDIIRYFYRRE